MDALASGLLALGIRAGDRVGIWSPNRVEWLLTQFATARMGAVLVNINPAYRLAELEYALNKVGCKAVIVDDVMRTGRDQLDSTTLDALEAKLNPNESINIQFTSGTTGNPKGATLTHRNIVNKARYIAMAMRLTEHDSLCIPVPLYHCFGMVLAVLACVSTGCVTVFPGEAFDPGATLTAVHDEKCTALHSVPTMLIAELDHPDFAKYDFSHLRTGIMAGSPCPIETMKRVVSKIHLSEITIAYGMAETSPVSFQSSTTDPLDKRTTTVGRIQPHLEVKIIDPLGNIVPVGETGELCTRGYSVMKGYWGDDEKTREAIVDGWMHTGDLVTLDTQGYCNIVGRLKDMLIRGGENIYPREIEEFLFRHPKVQSVQVFGVPDEKYGEEVCAWIVVRPREQATEDEMRDFYKGKSHIIRFPVTFASSTNFR
ncbi:Long-chain-fatty-acid--CoA ligase [Candidatus Paraburkholderia kirkii UZHbot1]|uniref:Long-chain-fatty-acid--CoA ligase n=1 Tax=Candidatus Paraburkholderia kirkii UZHbot1 TaxID=1055526 RepID=G4MH40_9BURK|nr:Long-chain-fatty-acid--CoA ligase [Candidatus Paraburkholderia kirkii UZHbot1]